MGWVTGVNIYIYIIYIDENEAKKKEERLILLLFFWELETFGFKVYHNWFFNTLDILLYVKQNMRITYFFPFNFFIQKEDIEKIRNKYYASDDCL